MDTCKYCGGELEIRTLKNGEDIYYCPACKRGFKISSSTAKLEPEQVVENNEEPQIAEEKSVQTTNDVEVAKQEPKEQMTDIDELKECLEDILIVIDESPVYNLEFYKLLLAIVDKMQKHYNNLAITERADISLFYDGMVANINNLKPFFNMGAIGKANLDAMVPTIKTTATNIYAKLS